MTQAGPKVVPPDVISKIEKEAKLHGCRHDRLGFPAI